MVYRKWIKSIRLKSKKIINTNIYMVWGKLFWVGDRDLFSVSRDLIKIVGWEWHFSDSWIRSIDPSRLARTIGNRLEPNCLRSSLI